MTSPYITFEEMEDGVIHNARKKASGELMKVQYKKSKGRLLGYTLLGWEAVAGNPDWVFAPIPVYTPPNSWDEYVDKYGDFVIIKNNKDSYFSNQTRNLANDKQLRAAIDWLQDELDRRKKAGES